MADIDFASLQDTSQLAANLNRVIEDQIEQALFNLHTILPAKVVHFDGNIITAQPTIKRLFINGGWVNLPLSVDCPVVFPSGGGMFLTFPIQAGDECLLLFSERSINGWFQTGDISVPTHYHTHSISDAFAMVGVLSKPKQLANVQTDGAELRNRERTTYIKMKDGLIQIKGNLEVTGTISATGTIAADGEVTAEAAGTPVNLSTHHHTGVQTGTGVTGGPVG